VPQDREGSLHVTPTYSTAPPMPHAFQFTLSEVPGVRQPLLGMVVTYTVGGNCTEKGTEVEMVESAWEVTTALPVMGELAASQVSSAPRAQGMRTRRLVGSAPPGTSCGGCVQESVKLFPAASPGMVCVSTRLGEALQV